MALINQSKPSTTFSNASKIGIGETWATIPTTWASETRTWEETVSLIDNTSKPTTTFTNIAKP